MKKSIRTFSEILHNVASEQTFVLHPDREMQIDVTDIAGDAVICNLYYRPGACVKIFMRIDAYKQLMDENVFVRQIQERDSAGVLNTTETYNLLVKINN